MARCIKYLLKLGDIMPRGFGDEGGGVIDDELAEEEDGRQWNDYGPKWVGMEGKRDGFMSTLMRAVSILAEGTALLGRPWRRTTI